MRPLDFIDLSSVGAAFLSMASLVRALPAGTRRPNVLFIASDDLNDWTGCLDAYQGLSLNGKLAPE